MKKCAFVLNGNDIVKVSNLKRKYNKFINNPDVKILEECNELLEERYNYWCQQYKKEVTEDTSIKKYYFKNPKTGHTITSIYPTLEHLKSYTNIEDWEFIKEN